MSFMLKEQHIPPSVVTFLNILLQSTSLEPSSHFFRRLNLDKTCEWLEQGRLANLTQGSVMSSNINHSPQNAQEFWIQLLKI